MRAPAPVLHLHDSRLPRSNAIAAFSLLASPCSFGSLGSSFAISSSLLAFSSTAATAASTATSSTSSSFLCWGNSSSSTERF
ncbi:hypothetical protein BHE74_00007011 [Ensete ventricosum]|nr:hypothetical protein BHE74_00007011 [Ensete ventricosum]